MSVTFLRNGAASERRTVTQKCDGHLLFLVLVTTALTACATYQSKTEDFRNAIRRGESAAAADKIKEQAFKDSDDQVVYLLEYATAQQLAKNFEESNKAYLKAEDLTDIKDYHSISRIGGSILLNEGMVQYKGDDFEKVLINAMLAINFLEQKKLDEALVECRKLNDKLYKFRYEGKKNYDQNPFAFYLSAMIWEAEKNWDNAYIDFKKAYDLNPSIAYLQQDLIRAATQAQRPEELAKWKKQFPNVKQTPSGPAGDVKEQGEVVLIFQQGWGPSKRPHPNFPRIPKLYPNYNLTTFARLEVENGPSETTQMISNINDVAIKTLDDQYSGLVAKRVGGIVAKEVVADQIRQKNELLGLAAWVGMHATDQADLRQWTTIPSSFQIAKLRLRPGNYRVRAVGLAGDSPSGEQSPWIDVKVDKRKKTFVNWRSLR